MRFRSEGLWRERTHPDDYARMMAGSLEPTFSNEYRVIWPDGQIRVLRSQMSTIYDDGGTPVRLRGIVTDVTAERETAIQLQRLAEVASRTGNAVIFANLEGRIEWVNDAFTRMSGWHLDEVVGKTPGEVLRGPLTDPATSAMMRAAIAARQPFECEILNHRQAGTLVGSSQTKAQVAPPLPPRAWRLVALAGHAQTQGPSVAKA